MKRILTAFCLGLIATTAIANTGKQKLEQKNALNKTLKEYVLLDNDIKKCYFPEMWEKPEDTNDLLTLWSEKEPSRFSLYTRIYYRLPYDKLPEDILKDMPEVVLHGEYENHQLDKVRRKYEKTTTVKQKKDCEKIGNYIHNELLKK